MDLPDSRLLGEVPLFGTELEEFHAATGYRTDSRKALKFLYYYTSNIFSNKLMREERRKQAGKKKKGDLSIFLNLPLDLVHEIFGHLHPLDIYHIAQTNKALRKTVLVCNAASLWKTCFERHPTIPACPPNMSEPQWTSLLFGPVICDECSVRPAFPDFTYLRRFCDVCMLKLQVSRETRENDQPLYALDDPIWNIVPGTYRQQGYHYWGRMDFEDVRKNGHYLLRELQATAQTLAELREADSHKALDSFKHESEARVIELMKHAEGPSKWAQDMMEFFGNEDWNRCTTLATRIRDRLVHHNPDDLDACNLDSFLLHDHPEVRRLTRQVWRKFRPLVESRVSGVRDKRLTEARRVLLDTRGQVIKAVYLEYQKTLDPALWISLPDYEELLKYDAFSTLLNSPSETRLTVPDCGEAIAKLPEYLEDWRQQKMKHLLVQLPTIPDADLRSRSPVDSLKLATSIFTCAHCETTTSPGICLFGWDDVCGHVRCTTSVRQGGKNFELSKVGSTVAMALVSFLGLDTHTASASDMDRVGARLLCTRCPIKSYRSVKGRKVYTWREYVAHVVQSECDGAHRKNSCDLLTSEATTLLRLHEDVYPHVHDSAWSCKHCPMHFSNFVPRRHAWKHAQQEHCISAPIEGKDFFHYDGLESKRTPRRPVGLSEIPPAEFRCALCPSCGTQLYRPLPLEQHLLDKHNILKPTLNTHFFKVTLRLKSMTPL